MGRHISLIFLATGVCLIILGLSTLATSPDLPVTLAKIAGIAFVVDAVLLCLLAAWAQDWRGFYLLGALTGIAGVALIVFDATHELFRLAVILGAVLTWRGLIDSLVAWGGVTDFTDTSPTLWEWTLLAVGVIIFLLGILAFITRGGSTFAILLIVAFQALARGIGMTAVSSRLRVLS